MKILLVDDDPVACSILTMLLEMQGHEVLEAADGELAWRMVAESQISFVVSDWMMPNLAGVDLCRRIRAANFDRYVYVILCTSKGAKSDLIEGLDAGADDFLVKPISPEELRVKVRAGERVLSLQQGLADSNRELAGINAQLQLVHKLVEDDLKAAALMQQRLLPKPAQQVGELRCAWRLEPSSYIAGDTFNFFPMDERRVAFYLLDVCGHGVPAAMLSVTLSMMMSPDASHGTPLMRYNPMTGTADALSPEDAIRELNVRFQSKDDRYFTMIYGVFDSATSTLRMAQAGHPGPVMLRKGCRPEILGSGGMPVGLWPEIEFDCFDVAFAAGDRLLLYSDGVTECVNAQGEAFGENRMLLYLEERALQPLDQLVGGLADAIREWRGHATGAFSMLDDVSLLGVEMVADFDAGWRI